MAFGRAAEDRPTPAAVYNWRLYLAATIACTGSLMVGYSIGIIGGTLTLPSFHAAFSLPPIGTRDYAYITANIVSIMQGGTFFGSLAAVPVTERWGRRVGLAVGGGAFAVGSAICTLSAGRLSLMYLGRFVGGLGIGATSLLVPLYISEISPPAIRGFLIGLFEIGNQLSSVTAFWLNFAALSIPSTSNTPWQLTLGLQIVPSTALFLGAIFILPESPRWYVKYGKNDRAQKTLEWLRNLPEDHDYIVRELGAMRNQVDREGGGTWRDLIIPGIRGRLAIGVGLMLCQNLTGINAVNYYSPSIFRSVGLTDARTILFASGIWAIIKALSTIGSLIFLVDSFGRRKILLIGAAGQAVAMLYIGGYVQNASSSPTTTTTATKADSTVPQTAAGWVAVIAIYIFAVFFCLAWNSVPWIYCAEIFPTRLRALCVSITTATQWLGQFGVARGTPYAIAEIKGGLYFIFGGSLVVMWIWVWGWLPETKGVALEDMDRIFGVPGAGRATAEERGEAEVEDKQIDEKKKETEE